MAKPRIFISSTFYDLIQVRSELDKFIESLGFESIRNEDGNIPYNKEKPLQEYCYDEISNVDILVSIIGGRFGNPAKNSDGDEVDYSITQTEIKTALEKNKLIYLFVDKNVLTEYETYVLNKSNNDIKYKYVDNIQIYKFIDEIKALSRNNNIKPFDTVDEIKTYLKEQWAGLFKQFIIESQKYDDQKVLREINDTASTLKALVEYFQETNKDKQAGMAEIFKINHPLVSQLKHLLHIPYNFYIEGKDDLIGLLSARGYTKMNSDEWQNESQNKMLTIKEEFLFNENKLITINQEDWKDEWVLLTDMPNEEIDLPF